MMEKYLFLLGWDVILRIEPDFSGLSAEDAIAVCDEFTYVVKVTL
jgi:hypothetical protein